MDSLFLLLSPWIGLEDHINGITQYVGFVSDIGQTYLRLLLLQILDIFTIN